MVRIKIIQSQLSDYSGFYVTMKKILETLNSTEKLH